MTLPRERRARLWVGTSGWQYDHWRGRFYPRALARRDWFSHYAAHFETVEINNTFYGLPAEGTFDAWRAAAPPGFLYALKLSRYATHLKHLKDPAPALRAFLERARRLRDRLGPILVQLPPRWSPDLPRLAGFLAELPRRQRFVKAIEPLVNFFLHAHEAGPQEKELFVQNQLLIAQLARHGGERIALLHPHLHGYGIGRRSGIKNLRPQKSDQQQAGNQESEQGGE